ncbi:MAG: hypothetical protein J7J98_03895 [candidate division Zixibacteria bacterium]|nr:hypothetical protein [candidate division Zixibacteria bacterium]
MNRKMLACILGLVVIMAGASIRADWVPEDGHKMHYPQFPNDHGWNVMGSFDQVLADDWQCSEDGPVTDLHFWGSWVNGLSGTINSFTITFYLDIPDPDGSGPLYSMPGPIVYGPVEIIDFTEVHIVPVPQAMEGWYDPITGDMFLNDHDNYFQYNIDYLPEPFIQTAGTIYWVSITANIVDVVDPQPLWGWKTTLNYFNDNGVVWNNDIQEWVELVEPSTGPIMNGFDVQVDPGGVLIGGNGEFGYANTWYAYDDDPSGIWYNIWFYDHPINTERFKEVFVQGVFQSLEPMIGGGYIEIAVNWSTPAWSLEGNPPNEPRRPPLPEDIDQIPGIYLMRQIIYNGPVVDAPTVLPGGVGLNIDEYNPEWISIDVRGENFFLEGMIQHECIGYTADALSPLEFAFVITGGSEPTGACCWPEGMCTVETEVDCVDPAGINGFYMGDASICAGDNNGNGVDDLCEGVANMGACCYGDPAAPSCINTTQTICEDASGQYAGTWYAGQDCASFICPITIGACCYDDGSCTSGLTQTACETSGGDYGGNGTNCAGTDVDQNGVDDFCDDIVTLGACCYGDPAAPICVNTTATVCGQTYNGTWYTGEDCATFICPIVGPGLGACCLPDGSCVRLTQVDCEGQGGDYAGSGTHCLGDGDANGIDDACEDREDRKWLQWPDLEPTGIDIFAMDYVVLADDYECTETGPLTKIEIWGSWLNDVLPEDGPGMVDFVISLHEDIPAGVVAPWSQPGEPICLYHFGAMDFEVAEVHIPGLVEGFWNPAEGYIFPGDTRCFKYTFTLPDRECFQRGTDEDSRIYWIDVQANAFAGPDPVFFGWKTSKDHWNDDAVWTFGVEPPTDPWQEMRYPAEHPYATQSVDLAFSVYGTCCVLRVGDANGMGGDEPTIGDCSVMIDALFISGNMDVIACIPEADVNQSGGISPGPGDITIGDISVLIDYLFITGPSLGLPDCF